MVDTPAEITIGKYTELQDTAGKNDVVPNILFHVTNLVSCGIKYDIGVTPNPLPENSAEESIIIKVTGNLLTIDISWMLKQSDTNTVTKNAFYTLDSKSVGQQIGFFTNFFQSTGVIDKYQFKINYSDNPFFRVGLITNMEFETTGDTPLAWTAKITMVIGNVVTVYELDIASEPNNFSSITNGHNNNKISWTAPDDQGGTPILNYTIQRKDQSSVFTDLYTTPNASTFTYNDTSAIAGTIYYYRVAANNGTLPKPVRGTYADPSDAVKYILTV